MKKIALIIAGTLAVGVFLGFLWGQSAVTLTNVASQPTREEAQRAVSLMIDYGNGMVRTYPDISVSPGETMLQLLEKQTQNAKLALRTKEFAGLGILVEQIGPMNNGDGGKYWQYWVNNASVTQAASVYVIKPGDVIEWKFLSYK